MTKETYNWAVDTLLDAYNNGQLFHGDCDKCAVGNLIGTAHWSVDFCTSSGAVQTHGNSGAYEFVTETLGIEADSIEDARKIAMKHLSKIYAEKGFTRSELAAIEFAFESSIRSTDAGYNYYKIIDTKMGQFIGLTAVLKVMAGMVEEEMTHNESQKRLETIARDKYAVAIQG